MPIQVIEILELGTLAVPIVVKNTINSKTQQHASSCSILEREQALRHHAKRSRMSGFSECELLFCNSCSAIEHRTGKIIR